ncbi:MAG: SulP family inorganic anion transporter [Myxococcaceae bacterium]
MTTLESQAPGKPWARDALASVVVFLVALPLCMGVAIASGAPPAAGLITGIIGGLVVGALQGSPLQVSGPAAGLAVLVWQLNQSHDAATVGVIIVAAGLIQVIASVLRGGRWFRTVPPSVINGMLSGIGVLIFASQFHVMVDDVPRAKPLLSLATIPLAIWKGITPDASLPHEEAALTGALTIVVMVLWGRAPEKLRVLPAPLAGVVVGSLLANLLSFPIAFVNVPADLLATIPHPSMATFSVLLEPAIWGAAAVLAAVASAETLLCATAVDRLHTGPRTNYDRELAAQGLGNVLCGLAGGLPMTGVIVRSSANVAAGAKTRLSAILHGAWILVLVVAFPQLLRLVPVASLAAVLVFTGYKLINPMGIKQLLKYGRVEVAIYAATVIGIVSTDLLKGVLLGLGLSVINLVVRMSRLSIRVEDEGAAGQVVVHLEGSATFIRLADIADALDGVPRGREVHVRFDRLSHLDHATLELLTSWGKQYETTGGSVQLDWEALEKRYATHGAPAAKKVEPAAPPVLITPAPAVPPG